MKAELLVNEGRTEWLVISRGQATFEDYEGNMISKISYKENPKHWQRLRQIVKAIIHETW